MNFFKKNKNKIGLFFFAITISLIVIGFSFTTKTFASTICNCDVSVGDGGNMVEAKEFPVDNGNCENLCSGGGKTSTATNIADATKQADAIDPAAGQDKGWNPLVWAFKKLFAAVLVFVGWLVLIAVVILKWILDPNNLKLFLDSDGIRDIWVMARDFLNIGFIFVLLFSAFCTIFQIDKYNIKSIIFKLILMALLVNFSFPIARFIIDVSNVMMYWLLNNMFVGLKDGAGLFASISGESGITGILLPGDAMGYDFQYILAAISFSFIFGITLLIIAVMFVIRLIALAVLVMFSPIGFAGAAFPMTAQYASKWWTALFKYSFFAPIMVFMLAVALKLMESAGSQSRKAMELVANSQTTDAAMGNFIAQGAYFVIPIVILWIGMGMAQTLGIAGAAAVTGKGQQFARWAGRQPWRGTKGLANATGIPGGVKAGVAKFQKNGKLFGVKVPLYTSTEKQEERESRWGGLVSGGLTGRQTAITDHERKKVNEKRKEWKDQGGADKKDLQDAVAKGAVPNAKTEDKIKAKAAALELAENHGFKDLNEFKNAANSVANDPVMKKMFDDKAKEKHIKFVIDKESEDTINKTEERLKEQGRSLTDDQKKKIRETVYNRRLSGMSTDDLAKQKDLHKGIATDTHLQEYIRNNIANDPGRHQQMFRKMNVANQKAYVGAGYDPRSMHSQGRQGQGQNQGQNQNQNQYQQYRHANYQNTP